MEIIRLRLCPLILPIVSRSSAELSTPIGAFMGSQSLANLPCLVNLSLSVTCNDNLGLVQIQLLLFTLSVHEATYLFYCPSETSGRVWKHLMFKVDYTMAV